MNNRIKRISRQIITADDLSYILKDASDSETEELFSAARKIREQTYGKDVYVRGLIEFTNFCRNDCYYCGIRKSNLNADRYRLTKDQILSCTHKGYQLGYRTFVLQGGEDAYYMSEDIADIISSIKSSHPDCAVTLSFGEWEYKDYKTWFEAGADRYLLRHETASDEHYKMLHPENMSLSGRKNCLKMLKEIGYQTGAGFMVGSPWQTIQDILSDLQFLIEFKPHMIGIGPFIPHKDTPFNSFDSGSLSDTLRLLSITRLLLPDALIPATTALGTISPDGREKGLLAGANVIMPNLSPENVREKYTLYNNKLCTGAEAAEYINYLKSRVNSTGYRITTSRGDFKPNHIFL